MVVALLSLALMLVVSSACGLLRSRVRGMERRLLALLALLTGGIWLRADGWMEGAVLWTLSKSHGVTVADLLVVVPLVAAARVVSRPARRSLLTR